MSLSTVLTRDTVAMGLKARDKEGIINELLDLLVKAGAVRDKPAALAAVLDRERKMSTGMKHGIAIPHGKTGTVSGLVACVGVSAEPVPFDSLDEEPARIFIMTLSPPEKTGPHLQFLAEVSQLFKSADKRAAILAAANVDDILAIIAPR